MSTPQTDTPETGNVLESILRDKGELCEDTAPFAFVRLCKKLERRALAAEARLAKWEFELSKVMPADFKDWWQNSREEWPEVARMVIEGLRKQVEMTDKAAEARVKELEAALRLRPIAEAGTVPEGTIRVYADFINGEWEVTTDKWNGDTHFIDIYPPQQ